MSHNNKENLVKRQKADSFDNTFNQPKKLLKLEKDNQTYEEEVFTDNFIINNDTSKINIHPYLNNKSLNLFSSINKNDILSIIWKCNFSYSNFFEKTKKISQQFISKRQDLWDFNFIYDEENQNLILSILVKNNKSKGKKFDNKIVEKQNSLSSLYLLDFILDINIQLVNPTNKTISINNKDIEYNTEYSYNLSLLEDITENIQYGNNVQIFFEFLINKKYSNLKNEKKIIGYIGMINEAMTCYMNSMIQTLNIFGAFKKAVFDIPTNEEDYNSVSLSLQRLFYDLMVKDTPVSTNKLIKSFGWGIEQMNIQHDVQEFNLLLSELMEKKMKGTPGEGTFSKLFEGKLINYIECINVNFRSEKEERFCDIQLTVKGCKNIYESFDTYISEEILDNEDKYFAEGYGKQKANKGIKFLKFPNILILQLKRFEYNQKREAMIKINEFFEFTDEINLEKYMYKKNNNISNTNENDDKEYEDNLYSLHSVVVHKGSANSGHYYAYIKPTVEDMWLQFNDEVVRPADSYEVFDNNFGGSYKSYKLKSKGEISETNYSFDSNAYILIYIKKSMRKNILNPITIENIPTNLRERFDNDILEEIKKTNKKNRLNDNFFLNLFTQENIINYDKIGINNSLHDTNIDDPFIMNNKRRFIINIPRFMSFRDLLNFISSETNIPEEYLKIYEYIPYNKENLFKRNDYTIKLLTNEELDAIIQNFSKIFKNQFPIFFLYVNENFQILKIKNNTNSQQENLEDFEFTNILQTNTGVIHISNTMNIFYFNKNNSNNFNNNLLSKIVPEEKGILIFLKEIINLNSDLNIDDFNNNGDNFTIKITKIFYFNSKKSENLLNDLKKEIIDKKSTNIPPMNDNDFEIILERTCVPDLQHNIFYEILTEENIFNYSERLNNFVLIPFSKKNENHTKRKIEENFNLIYLDLYCLNNNTLIYEKLEFDIREISEEKIIKEKIINILIEKNLFKNIFCTQDHYILTNEKTIIKIEELFKIIDSSYFDIANDRDSNGKTIQMFREIPISKFINFKEMRIDMTFSYLSKNQNSDKKNLDIKIYDKNNNKIALISCALPKRLRKCREITEYILTTEQSSLIFHNKDWNLDNYFYILQNSRNGFIYHIITEMNSDLFKFEGKGDYEYRLQNFDDEFISKINISNYIKIFIKVVLINRNNIVDPFIVYMDKNQKNFELKMEINKILANLIKIKEILNEVKFEDFFKSEENVEKIKYFKSILCDGKIKKNLNINNYKEDDLLDYIFKGERIYNLLVEINFNNNI